HTHRLSPIPHAFQVSMSVLTHTTATTETSTLSLHDALPIYIGGALMAGLAGGDRGRDRRMAGDRERRSGQARRAELEAARIDVARRVAARAVAVEAAHGEVIGGHTDDRDRVARRRAGERSGVRAMAAQTPADPLVDSGD